jgi:hypothetical protein
VCKSTTHAPIPLHGTSSGSLLQTCRDHSRMHRPLVTCSLPKSCPLSTVQATLSEFSFLEESWCKVEKSECQSADNCLQATNTHVSWCAHQPNTATQTNYDSCAVPTCCMLPQHLLPCFPDMPPSPAASAAPHRPRPPAAVLHACGRCNPQVPGQCCSLQLRCPSS